MDIKNEIESQLLVLDMLFVVSAVLFDMLKARQLACVSKSGQKCPAAQSLSSRRAWIETTLTIGLYSMLCRPRLSFCVKLPSRRCVVISDAEFDRWGEAAERGDYGGSKGPVIHGPIFPVDADYPDSVSLGVSADMLALVDAKARRLGVGRDDVIRHAIARDLVDA